MDLGQLLKKKRTEKNLTLEQVSKVVGVSKNTISKYERNMIINIGKSKVVALSKLLDIPIVNFFEIELEEIRNDE